MELKELSDNVLSVLIAELDERDYAIFVLKVLGSMSNTAIGRALGIRESSIRKRFKRTTEEDLKTITGYIYEGGEIVDKADDGEFLRTTAKFRNAIMYMKKTGRSDD